MTLYELALEYKQTASLLWGRIKELEQAKKEGRTLGVDARIRLLRSMYQDTRKVVRHLESYYRKQATPGHKGG